MIALARSLCSTIGLALICQCCFCLALHGEQPPLTRDETLFRETIAPMLVSKCLTCHGGESVEGGYSLASLEWMLRPGDSELAPIVFGQPESSELLRRLTTEDEQERMPAEAQPLNSAEIAVVRQWLQGTNSTSLVDSRRPLALWQTLSRRHETPEHYPHPIAINALTVSRDGQQIAVGGYGEVTVWDSASGELQRRLPAFGPHIGAVQFSSDNQWLCLVSGTPGEQGVVEVIDWRSLTVQPKQIATLGDVPRGVRFSPDARQIAIGGNDGVLRIASLQPDAVELRELASHADAILDVAWSRDGARLLTASRDRTAKLFDTTNWELLISYARHERAVGGVGFCGDNPVTLDETGALRVMDGRNLENDRTVAEQTGLPRRLQSFAGWDSTIAVADDALRMNNTPRSGLRIFDLRREVVDDGKTEEGTRKTKTLMRLREQEAVIITEVERIESLSIADDLLVGGTDHGTVWVWRRSDWALLRRFTAAP